MRERMACGLGLVAHIELALMLGYRITADAIALDPLKNWLALSYAAGESISDNGSGLSLAEGAIVGYAATGNAERVENFVAQRDQWRRFAA